MTFENHNFEMFEEVVHNFGLTVTLFSEKMLIFTGCIHGFMSNMIKKSWTVSIEYFEEKNLRESILGNSRYILKN